MNNEEKPSAARIIDRIDKAIQNVGGAQDESAFPMALWEAPAEASNSEAETELEADQILYEYLAMRRMKSFADARIKAIKKKFPEFFNADGVEPGEGSSVIKRGQLFSLEAKARAGASFVDNKTLIAELRKAGVSADVVAAALKEASRQRNPSITIDGIINI